MSPTEWKIFVDVDGSPVPVREVFVGNTGEWLPMFKNPHTGHRFIFPAVQLDSHGFIKGEPGVPLHERLRAVIQNSRDVGFHEDLGTTLEEMAFALIHFTSLNGEVGHSFASLWPDWTMADHDPSPLG